MMSCECKNHAENRTGLLLGQTHRLAQTLILSL